MHREVNLPGKPHRQSNAGGTGYQPESWHSKPGMPEGTNRIRSIAPRETAAGIGTRDVSGGTFICWSRLFGVTLLPEGNGGGRIRTCDLQGMNLTSYRAALPRINSLAFRLRSKRQSRMECTGFGPVNFAVPCRVFSKRCYQAPQIDTLGFEPSRSPYGLALSSELDAYFTVRANDKGPFCARADNPVSSADEISRAGFEPAIFTLKG